MSYDYDFEFVVHFPSREKYDPKVLFMGDFPNIQVEGDTFNPFGRDSQISLFSITSPISKMRFNYRQFEKYDFLYTQRLHSLLLSKPWLIDVANTLKRLCRSYNTYYCCVAAEGFSMARSEFLLADICLNRDSKRLVQWFDSREAHGFWLLAFRGDLFPLEAWQCLRHRTDLSLAWFSKSCILIERRDHSHPHSVGTSDDTQKEFSPWWPSSWRLPSDALPELF